MVCLIVYWRASSLILTSSEFFLVLLAVGSQYLVPLGLAWAERGMGALHISIPGL